MLTITPDYDLFLKILLVLWAFKGVLSIVCGFAVVDMQRKEAGIAEIVFGGMTVALVAWVIL